jgi:AcrR family transcriptional regulator
MIPFHVDSSRSEDRRWGSKERVDNEDDARERLLNAAEVCFERQGLRRTTIEDVAREAKVSRSTVYRYFDGRGDLIVAAHLRENQAVNEKVKSLMSRPGSFSERFLEATIRSIYAIRSGKYLPLMLSPEGALLASKSITASKAFYDNARATMKPFVERAKAEGEIRADLELDDLIEWNVRIIFSFAMFDGPIKRDRASLSRLIGEFMLPALNREPPAPTSDPAP